MVNLKTLLDTRRAKSDGSFNIIFRITQNRKVYTLNSGVSISLTYWNDKRIEIDKSHPNANLLNLKITQKYFKIQKAILQLDDEFSIEQLRFMIDDNPKKQLNTTFKTFSDKLISQMIEVNRTGNAIIYQTAVNRLLSFYGRDDLGFQEIDYSLLDDFAHHLSMNGLKQNSISNYFRSIRAIYNKAIKAKIIERSNYPFAEISIRTEKTAKRAVSKDDITKLIRLNLETNSTAERSLKYFLLSFYLRGMSFTDMAYLKQSNIIDGRVEYKRRKTHKNYSIKLFPEAQVLFKQFNVDGSKYLLPILPNDALEDSLGAKKLIRQFIKTTNKYLKRLSEQVGLSSPVTTYTSRHSFGTIAKRLGYSNELIAEALGHEFGNKITNIYLDTFDTDVLDAMHKHVIS
ncbi:site-specific integrase [Flavobacterium ammonificans]|uniref:site-specific integrase n=1 Tax=Flavobacterium ammonificans TaxID=1751056 RepID=UPI001E37363D|nr:site-specific integrase [Flavobacterium ammonificans]BDB56319.1 tyrosine recombinase [Flavobacterium ammonificans]